jgi:hypothetical protein
LPLPDFYPKNGFRQTEETGDMMYLPLEDKYSPNETHAENKPSKGDKDKAIILHSPTCQFSYGFAKRIENSIGKIAPHPKIELINEWKQPEEAAKRKNWWLTVNGKRIHTFFMETAKFEDEVRLATNE